MVTEGDSCSKGCGFKSRCHILDGHDIFSHVFVVRIVMSWNGSNISLRQRVRSAVVTFLGNF